MTNRDIFAKNLLIHTQLKELLEEFHKQDIKIILLKGAGLIELFPEYMREREMEDIDLLIKPEQLKKTKAVLQSIGYSKNVSDPYAFTNPAKPLPVDLCPGLWYLSKEENDSLWKGSNCLEPIDFYIHILAHSVVHHKQFDSRWAKDLELLKSKYPDELAQSKIETKIQSYAIKLPLNLPNSGSPVVPLSGHISRFSFLPFNKKISYIFGALFPSLEFIKGRYDTKNELKLLFLRLLRPFLLGLNVLRFVFYKTMNAR
ncbi:MAG: hypothetical protein A3J83_02390 [Elusimicrobia bacterium RIFOXYA2_FULL_40_6]|nr:MAG: hypothetical protein A3J83_02390 [Elusimicrobia bacterium RIFOXYA2_FULL_40_6]